MGGILACMSLTDSTSQVDRKFVRSAAAYLFASAAGWFTIGSAVWITSHAPHVEAPFSIFKILAIIPLALPTLLFYLIVRRFGAAVREKKYDPIHFADISIIAAGVMIIGAGTLMIGADTLMLGAGLPRAAAMVMSLIFCMMCYALTIHVFAKPFRGASGRGDMRPIIFLAAISLPMLPAAFLTVHSAWIAVVAPIAAAQHILLVYSIVRRRYVPYIMPRKFDAIAETRSATLPERSLKRRVRMGSITSTALEAYFREYKPYIRNDLRITDLEDVFDVSRASVSGFINKTYGMNFSRYVNRWRLAELERIAALPPNLGKSIDSYVGDAGFTDRRQYNRVARIERVACNNLNDRHL